MVLSDYTGQEDMKKARFYAGLIHLLDFLGWYKIIKWGGVNRTILSSVVILKSYDYRVRGFPV